MKKLCRSFVPILFSIFVSSMNGGAAQQPFTLLHSLFDPSTNAQVGAGQGYSVAVDGDIVVTGAPYDDMGATDCGAVKVYHATTGVLLHTLTNPAPKGGDWFGYSVAISGKWVVVGALRAGTANGGGAYVYNLDGSTPTVPEFTLTNPSPSVNDGFGISVAVSDTRVAIGEYLGDNGMTNAGAVFIYDLISPSPAIPVLVLTNPFPAEYDAFGSSVAIAGKRVVIGAPADKAEGPDAGSAYVYDLASATPAVPIAVLPNPSLAAYDRFGSSVAVSGSRVVIGEYSDSTLAFDAGRAYVYDVAGSTPTVPIATLDNPSPTANDWFGYSVSISGTWVVVGAGGDDTGASDSGTTYVYNLAGSTPTIPIITLTNPGPSGGDGFGRSVAISEMLVVVGAEGDDTGSVNAGSVYVYDLVSSEPAAPIATLNHPGPVPSDTFGNSVSISKARLLIGTPYDDTGANDSGKAYVFDLTSATPTLPVVTLTNPSASLQDHFGVAAAISGTFAVIGADTDNTGAFDAGSAYVYNLTSSVPAVPILTLTNPIPATEDYFGGSVAICGTRVVVGVRSDDIGTVDRGSAYVFDLASATPAVPVVRLINPKNGYQDFFGNAVAISGTRIVVGASFDNTGASDAGSTYVYDLASVAPAVPLITLTNPSPAVSDYFGCSVAISGTRVVIGAYGDDTGANEAGIAYVFNLASGTPTIPVVALNNPNPVALDSFGWSVAISGDFVVVGAKSDDLGPYNAGSAYVYDLNSATPSVPLATLNKPSPAVGDLFGYAVAIDGTTVVAGAPYDDTNAGDRGAAYVFGLRPALRIAPAAPSFATISWTPVTSPGFELHYSDALAPDTWFRAPSGTTNPVTVSTTNGSQFYQLRPP